MTITYTLPTGPERGPEHHRYHSVAEARDDLVDFGTDTSKRLFLAAQMACEINHADDLSNPLEAEAIFLLTLAAMRSKQVVLAGETTAIEDIKGVGSYEYPWFSYGRLARISELAVLPAHQKSGIGSAILQHIETDLISQGANEIHLQARPTAKPFYEKNGYRAKVGKLYDMYKDLSSI
jgi:GNAT superfamily N-acetyltransferase